MALVAGFDSQQGYGIFLYPTASRLALRPTQTPIHWVPVELSWGLNHPFCEADDSPLSNAEVKSDGALPPLLYASSWHGA
jgi:hypothetical protein